MPKVRRDWTAVFDVGESTSGWEVEMHLRSQPGQTAVAKFSTADDTMLVGQAVDSGSTYGLAVNAAAADMDFAAGVYFADILRIDGGLNADVLAGATIRFRFDEPITEQGVD